jgi:hypothetical protein
MSVGKQRRVTAVRIHDPRRSIKGYREDSAIWAVRDLVHLLIGVDLPCSRGIGSRHRPKTLYYDMVISGNSSATALAVASAATAALSAPQSNVVPQGPPGTMAAVSGTPGSTGVGAVVGGVIGGVIGGIVGGGLGAGIGAAIGAAAGAAIGYCNEHGI